MMDLTMIKALKAALQIGGKEFGRFLLLEDADNNIGNGTVVMPQNSLNQAVPALIPELSPPRILSLSGASPTGRMVTVVLTASLARPFSVADVSNEVLVGPITGIIEFGNGSVFTKVEVDIPVGAFNFPVANAPSEPQDGGVIVSVPAGTLRVYARHDGGYITPSISGATPDHATGTGLQIPDGGSVNPVNVKAFATYSSRVSLKMPTKTLYLGAPLFGAAAGGGLEYSIPRFAKRMRILRDPRTNLLTYRVLFEDTAANGRILGAQDFVAPAAPFALDQFVDIPGTTNAINIKQTADAPNPTNNFFALEFEIQI